MVHSLGSVNGPLSSITQTVLHRDAPLSLPNGRLTIHDRAGEHLRVCDRALLCYGIHFFPITLGPMRMLTERGLVLKQKLSAMGYQTVECYPGAAQDLWEIPRNTEIGSAYSLD